MTYVVSNNDAGATVRAGTDERDGRHEGRMLQQRWHGWGSPVGLGLGLLSVGGFFVLLALGLSVLASIGRA
jgi:hypothetical protein